MMFKTLIPLFLITVLSTQVFASATAPCIPLVVTHPHVRYDHNTEAKEGIISRIAEHQACGSEIYVLLGRGLSSYLSNEILQKPVIQNVPSENGENTLFIRSNLIEVTGGYFELCHWFSVSYLVKNRIKNKFYEDLTIVVPTRATYSTYEYGSQLLSKKLEHHGFELARADLGYTDLGFSARNFENWLNFEHGLQNICVQIKYRIQTTVGPIPREQCKTTVTLQLMD